jgi:hypothetical protein
LRSPLLERSGELGEERAVGVITAVYALLLASAGLVARTGDERDGGSVPVAGGIHKPARRDRKQIRREP